MTRFSSPSIHLWDNVQHGYGLIANWGDGHTGALRDWRRSIRRKGGWWRAEGELSPPMVSRDTLIEMYLEGMCRRVTERVGQTILWAGMVVKMELTLDGVVYVREILPCANAVRTIYSRSGTNLFSDGSVESAEWTEVGSCLAHEQSTAWVTKGTYSQYVHTDGGGEGTEIERDIPIVAGRAYECTVSVYVESGVWTLYIYNQTDDSVLASRSTIDTGDDTLTVRISEDNTYTGNVYVRILADGVYGREVYCDNAIFKWMPYKAETGWYTDADSITEYGRKEAILLEGVMSGDSAAALAQTELARRAWPRSLPPERFYIGRERSRAKADKLELTFAGYVWTLNWHYMLAQGDDTASNLITTLIGESSFVTLGNAETNSLTYQVEEDTPIGVWDQIEAIIDAGDASGNHWHGGVYSGRKFRYEQVTAENMGEYRFVGNQVFSLDGGMIEPWYMLPGIGRIDSLPIGTGSITGNDMDDPRRFYLEQVEYIAPDQLQIWRAKTDLD